MLQLSNLQKEQLLEIARSAVRARLGGGETPDMVCVGVDQRCGVFVSIHMDGGLRGCIGRIESDLDLGQTTAECAVSAAFDDPRFVPMSLVELEAATFEVSVLSPLENVADVNTIEVGRHGLVIEQRGRRGLLLPQVATSYGWDRVEFLRQTAVKAGLDPDAWQAGASISAFEAVVFQEG